MHARKIYGELWNGIAELVKIRNMAGITHFVATFLTEFIFKMLIVIVQNRKGLKYINYILFFIIQEFSVLFGATGNGCKRQQGLKRQEISLMSENQCESNCSSSLVFHIGMIGLGLKHSSHINSFDKVSYDKLFFWLLIISVQNAFVFQFKLS